MNSIGGMMCRNLCLGALLLILEACGTGSQGIKVRAESPPIDDAFRKLTIALQVDDYAIRSVQTSEFRAGTEWRDAKEKELTKKEKESPAGSVQCRVDLRLERRGQLYDIFVIPYLRTRNGAGAWVETPAASTHPLYVRWQQIITALVQKEHRDEE
jgi:hypothetical protein